MWPWSGADRTNWAHSEIDAIRFPLYRNIQLWTRSFDGYVPGAMMVTDGRQCIVLLIRQYGWRLCFIFTRLIEAFMRVEIALDAWQGNILHPLLVDVWEHAETEDVE